MDPKQPARVQKKNVMDYSLLKSSETPSPTQAGHVLVPTSSDLPQYRRLEISDIFTLHLKIRTSPFSKRRNFVSWRTSIPSLSEDEEFVNWIDRTHST
jgi:hypothetical protein